MEASILIEALKQKLNWKVMGKLVLLQVSVDIPMTLMTLLIASGTICS